MRRLLPLFGIAALLLVGCGGGGEDDDQLTDAKVKGRCPSQQLKGEAATFSVQVENTGEEEWPAVFVESTGIRSVTVSGDEAIDGSGSEGRFWGGRDFTTYRFGRLAVGATQSYELTVTPTDSNNRSDVRFAAWGDQPDAEALPRSSRIDFHECKGPWGDGR